MKLSFWEKRVFMKHPVFILKLIFICWFKKNSYRDILMYFMLLCLIFPVHYSLKQKNIFHDNFALILIFSSLFP